MSGAEPFGLRPPEGYAGPWYGARVIWRFDGRYHSLDFVWNRQQFTDAGEGPNTPFRSFVRNRLYDVLQKELKAHDLRPGEAARIEAPVDGYVVAFRGGGGYLYVGVWLAALSPDHAGRH